MNAQDVKLVVALYLRGNHLDPKQVTRLFNVQPSRVQVRGQRSRTSTGHEITADIGLWALIVECQSPSLDDHLKQLVDLLPAQLPLSSVSGLEEAYVDVFAALASDRSGEVTCNLGLSSIVLARLGELGVPMRLTITAGPD